MRYQQYVDHFESCEHALVSQLYRLSVSIHSSASSCLTYITALIHYESLRVLFPAFMAYLIETQQHL